MAGSDRSVSPQATSAQQPGTAAGCGRGREGRALHCHGVHGQGVSWALGCAAVSGLGRHPWALLSLSLHLSFEVPGAQLSSWLICSLWPWTSCITSLSRFLFWGTELLTVDLRVTRIKGERMEMAERCPASRPQYSCQLPPCSPRSSHLPGVSPFPQPQVHCSQGRRASLTCGLWPVCPVPGEPGGLSSVTGSVGAGRRLSPQVLAVSEAAPGEGCPTLPWEA